MIKNKTVLKIGLLFGLLTIAQSSYALYPRAYIAAPSDTLLFVGYFNNYYSEDLFSNDNRLNATLSRNVLLLRPTYYGDVFNMRYVINAIVGTAKSTVEGSSVPGRVQESNGMTDPILQGSVFLINDNTSRTWLALGEYIYFPYGEYDHRLVYNLGDNRYRYITELALAQGLGDYHLDATLSASIYGVNNDWTVASSRREQDMLWSFETHITRDIRPGMFAGIGLIFDRGGETKINGTPRNDEIATNSFQVSFQTSVSKTDNLAVFYKKDLEVKNGFKLGWFSLRYVHRY